MRIYTKHSFLNNSNQTFEVKMQNLLGTKHVQQTYFYRILRNTWAELRTRRTNKQTQRYEQYCFHCFLCLFWHSNTHIIVVSASFISCPTSGIKTASFERLSLTIVRKTILRRYLPTLNMASVVLLYLNNYWNTDYWI